MGADSGDEDEGRYATSPELEEVDEDEAAAEEEEEEHGGSDDAGTGHVSDVDSALPAPGVDDLIDTNPGASGKEDGKGKEGERECDVTGGGEQAVASAEDSSAEKREAAKTDREESGEKDKEDKGNQRGTDQSSDDEENEDSTDFSAMYKAKQYYTIREQCKRSLVCMTFGIANKTLGITNSFRYHPAHKPTQSDLFNEMERRIILIKGVPKLPDKRAKKWEVAKLANWLVRNPIQDEKERNFIVKTVKKYAPTVAPEKPSAPPPPKKTSIPTPPPPPQIHPYPYPYASPYLPQGNPAAFPSAPHYRSPVPPGSSHAFWFGNPNYMPQSVGTYNITSPTPIGPKRVSRDSTGTTTNPTTTAATPVSGGKSEDPPKKRGRGRPRKYPRPEEKIDKTPTSRRGKKYDKTPTPSPKTSQTPASTLASTASTQAQQPGITTSMIQNMTQNMMQFPWFYNAAPGTGNASSTVPSTAPAPTPTPSAASSTVPLMAQWLQTHNTLPNESQMREMASWIQDMERVQGEQLRLTQQQEQLKDQQKQLEEGGAKGPYSMLLKGWLPSNAIQEQQLQQWQMLTGVAGMTSLPSNLSPLASVGLSGGEAATSNAATATTTATTTPMIAPALPPTPTNPLSVYTIKRKRTRDEEEKINEYFGEQERYAEVERWNRDATLHYSTDGQVHRTLPQEFMHLRAEQFWLDKNRNIRVLVAMSIGKDDVLDLSRKYADIEMRSPSTDSVVGGSVGVGSAEVASHKKGDGSNIVVKNDTNREVTVVDMNVADDEKNDKGDQDTDNKGKSCPKKENNKDVGKGGDERGEKHENKLKKDDEGECLKADRKDKNGSKRADEVKDDNVAISNEKANNDAKNDDKKSGKDDKGDEKGENDVERAESEEVDKSDDKNEDHARKDNVEESKNCDKPDVKDGNGVNRDGDVGCTKNHEADEMMDENEAKSENVEEGEKCDRANEKDENDLKKDKECPIGDKAEQNDETNVKHDENEECTITRKAAQKDENEEQMDDVEEDEKCVPAAEKHEHDVMKDEQCLHGDSAGAKDENVEVRNNDDENTERDEVNAKKDAVEEGVKCIRAEVKDEHHMKKNEEDECMKGDRADAKGENDVKNVDDDEGDTSDKSDDEDEDDAKRDDVEEGGKYDRADKDECVAKNDVDEIDEKTTEDRGKRDEGKACSDNGDGEALDNVQMIFIKKSKTGENDEGDAHANASKEGEEKPLEKKVDEVECYDYKDIPMEKTQPTDKEDVDGNGTEVIEGKEESPSAGDGATTKYVAEMADSGDEDLDDDDDDEDYKPEIEDAENEKDGIDSHGGDVNKGGILTRRNAQTGSYNTALALDIKMPWWYYHPSIRPRQKDLVQEIKRRCTLTLRKNPSKHRHWRYPEYVQWLALHPIEDPIDLAFVVREMTAYKTRVENKARDSVISSRLRKKKPADFLRLFHIFIKDEEMKSKFRDRDGRVTAAKRLGSDSAADVILVGEPEKEKEEKFWSEVAKIYTDPGFNPQSVVDGSIHEACCRPLDLSLLMMSDDADKAYPKELQLMFERCSSQLLNILKRWAKEGGVVDLSGAVSGPSKAISRSKRSGFFTNVCQFFILYLWYLCEEHNLMDGVGPGNWVSAKESSEETTEKTTEISADEPVSPKRKKPKPSGGSEILASEETQKPTLEESSKASAAASDPEQSYREAVLFYSSMAEKVTKMEEMLDDATDEKRRKRIEDRLGFMEDQLRLAKEKVDKLKPGKSKQPERKKRKYTRRKR